MASRSVLRKVPSSIRKEAGIWDQLRELKAVTIETGTIHDAQKYQLQMWGWLAAPHADSFEVAVGLPHMESKTEAAEYYIVEYRINATNRPPKNLKNLLEGLTRSIRDLLGDHFTVVVKVNGKVIFMRKGSRKKESSFKKTYERFQKNAKSKRG